jgi:hypothetical protein
VTNLSTQSIKWHRKYAWVLFVIVSLPFLIFGISALLFGLSLSDFPVGIPGGPEAVRSLTGMPWDEVLSGDEAAVTLLRGVSRLAGLAFLGFGILLLVVTILPFRQGHRWAWFTLWTVPGFMIGLLVHELQGDFVQMPAMFLILSLLGLLLSFRNFFPRGYAAG